MNVPPLISLRTVVLASLLGLAPYTTGAAQQAPTPRARAGRPAAERAATEQEKAEHLSTFRGTATKLKTTPAALEAAFERAREANAKLTRGQFTAASMLARNLGASHANMTTQAILSGLKGGKSMGQTLQGLGLSASEAKKAKKDADREAKEATKDAKSSL